MKTENELKKAIELLNQVLIDNREYGVIKVMTKSAISEYLQSKCDHEYVHTNLKYKPVNHQRCIHCQKTIND